MNLTEIDSGVPVVDSDKWLRFLTTVKQSKRSIWIDLLLMFFYQPGHEASVKTISKQYAMSEETVKIILTNISNKVSADLNVDGSVLTPEQKLEILFEIRREKENILTVRKNLVSALRIFLIDSLICIYRKPVLSEGLNSDNSEELYKWQTFAKFRDKTTEEILNFMCIPGKENNFLNWRITDPIKKALKEHPKETIDCFDALRSTKGGFYDKFSSFIDAGRTFLSNEAADIILRENVASVFLTFVDPTEFVIYRWSLYALISKYLGYKTDKSKPYRGFIEILQQIADRENNDKELTEKLYSETEDYFWSHLLNAQDIIWQTQNYIKQSFPKNWLQKENLQLDELDTDMNKYIEILKANHNLILTGAPGTGKTYLSKKIAEAMGDPTPGFVQFHPSMDYTDFVEGLRPAPETGGFERKDGVFKKFCKEAISGIRFSDFDEAYNVFINHLLELPETSNIVKLKTPKSGAEFGVSVNSKLNLNLHTGKNLQQQGVLKRDDLKRSFSGEKIYDYWSGYYEGVVKHLKDEYHLKEAAQNPNPSNKVFIIDEINRGELSKIFGELFFSIEPSYRGEKHRVQTQYQNLVSQGDPFENGFYIPENVYIIGTMNDIDRSVESIDFAIRRRFGWMEVKPEDRIDMLAELIPEYSEDAAKVMECVNKTLTGDVIGLPEAYEIGPAYFLKLNEYDGDFQKLWAYNIRGLLYEYLRGDRAIDDKMKILKESFFNALKS